MQNNAVPLLPVVLLPGGVVWDHHAVSDDSPGGGGGAGEQTHRVTRVQNQCLLI
jgi:hypothetical protein